MDASVRLYRMLLSAYPCTFRGAYGEEMVRTFRQLLREERSRGAGMWACFWARILSDLALTALKERSEAMKGREFLLLGAALLGIGIAWVDSRPTWDDTGITVGTILLTCAIFGAIDPRKAWQWALAVGIWIPLHGLLWAHNFGTLIALIPAFLGAYLGAGIRSLGFPPPHQA
jgi:hypothetical protein